jgi:small subunit ribosomal protein S20
MANHFSALKRARQTKKRTERNRSARARLRHSVRDLRTTIATDPAKAKDLLPATASTIDKAVKKGLIKENTASRFKSRLAIRLAKASAAKA